MYRWTNLELKMLTLAEKGHDNRKHVLNKEIILK